MKIVEKMFDGPLDVVGDVHGQIDALQDLLRRLDYAPDGAHPEGRRLVFVGDLVDRGPDSPGVVELVMNMVESGHAQCVMGNHELNIARGSKKLDNGWYFEPEGGPGSLQAGATDSQRQAIFEFFNDLPLALEREDLRVVHACWHDPSISQLNALPETGASVGGHYRAFRDETNVSLEKSGVMTQYREEQSRYDDLVRFGNSDPDTHWPEAKLLTGYAQVNEARQMGNPISVVTSGEERAAQRTYPAGGKFRFVNRVAWWDNYEDEQAVIIGHYWRLYDFNIVERPRSTEIDVFKGAGPDQWLGARNNVYCADFSVGGRSSNYSSDICRLAAVRWPEATVMFDNGETLATEFRN